MNHHCRRDTGPAAEAGDFIKRLHQLRTRAGRPSFRRLALLGGREFAASTIADTLNGRRKSVAWPFVYFFVTACIAHAHQYRIELTLDDSDLRVWWQRWQQMEVVQ